MKTIFLGFITLVFWGGGVAYAAGPYTNSAHGSSSSGVERTDYPSALEPYAQGNCAHCHEQHASIEGSDTGADIYLLFNTKSTNVSGSAPSGFCFDCHGGSSQTLPAISINRSYSYNFGGNGTLDDSTIKAQFYHTAAPGSSHYLPDIDSQILGVAGLKAADGTTPVSLSANLDPCDACHNPHIAQRNYPVAIVDSKLKTAISRPSDHDNLWGDSTDNTERMDKHNYEATCWGTTCGPTANREPAEDTTANGSNMPDYVTFCTDCHNTYNTINSTNPRLPSDRPAAWGSTLRKIDWWDKTDTQDDKHGKKAADDNGVGDGLDLRAPYSTTLNNKVLSCTDCHEPHGSKNNVFLIRSEVNDGNLDSSITTFSTTAWKELCERCHNCSTSTLLEDIHHTNGPYFPYKGSGAPYKQCSDCHGGGGQPPIACNNCHFHGADDSWATGKAGGPSGRRTF